MSGNVVIHTLNGTLNRVATALEKSILLMSETKEEEAPIVPAPISATASATTTPSTINSAHATHSSTDTADDILDTAFSIVMNDEALTESEQATACTLFTDKQNKARAYVKLQGNRAVQRRFLRQELATISVSDLLQDDL